MEINKIYTGDSVELINDIDDESIDLVVTSPPYYNSGHKYQRGTGYHYSFDVGEPLYVIYDVLENLKNKLKEDGVVCMNLSFSYGETGVMRPFDIINRVRNKIGYFVNDIIIWHKNNPIPLQRRLTNAFEFIFVLSKNPIGKYYTKEYTHNVWKFPVATSGNGHSAVYPEELSDNCVVNFSKKGDLVLDPFMGSGTTAISAKKHERNFLGFDINPDYVELANKRIKQEVLI